MYLFFYQTICFTQDIKIMPVVITLTMNEMGIFFFLTGFFGLFSLWRGWVWGWGGSPLLLPRHPPCLLFFWKIFRNLTLSRYTTAHISLEAINSEVITRVLRLYFAENFHETKFSWHKEFYRFVVTKNCSFYFFIINAVLSFQN